MKYAAAVDIGGTHTRVAIINENYEIENKVQFPTTVNDPKPTIDKICQAVENANVIGIGLSCPGPLDLKKGLVLTPPNLHANWHGLPIVQILQKQAGKPAYLENDANLAAYGEAILGLGKGFDIVQYLTISTGLGAGLVINKKIFQGSHGFANEVANTILLPNGPSHGDIIPGGIEALCSGTGIESRAKKAGLNVNHAGQVNGLAKQGNSVAMQIMQEAKELLANYLAGIQAYIDPDIIILGGSVALKIDGFVEEVEQLTKQKVYPILAPYVNIKKSVLHDDAGLLGAACLCFGENQ